MSPHNDLLTRFITRYAMMIATLVVLTIPLGYFINTYIDTGKALEFKAQIKSNILNDLISDSPETWMYAENRINGLISREPVILTSEFVEVFNAKNSLITTHGMPPSRPRMVRSVPLFDSGQIVGRISITHSISDIFIMTLMSFLFSLLLGSMILLVLRHLPLRALNKLSDELFIEKERAEITLHFIADAVITTDIEQRILYVNPITETMLGLTQKQLLGQRVPDVIRLLTSSNNEPTMGTLEKALTEQRITSCEGQSVLAIAGKKKLPVEERASPIFDQHGNLTGGVLCLRDVSVAREYVQRRSWEATHDSLTGLTNRREFENYIHVAINNAKMNHRHYAVCYMDLDRFKVVNDSSGHAAGDELLIQLTQLIKSMVRDSDVFARLGGDEFGLLLNDCNLESAQIIANEILAAVRDFQFSWDGVLHKVGISIGLTSITLDKLNVSEVLGEADSACYWAKEQGRNRVCIYLASDTDLAARRSETGWVARITAALKDNRFVLYHQTYRTLTDETNHCLHLEVLLRMLDDDGEIIAPGSFLPAAERYNLTPDIDRWVINKVFSEFSNLTTVHFTTDLMININISGDSLNSPNLLEFIESRIQTYKVNPKSICFEVTETAAVKNMKSAVEFINACKDLGIKFALDDFGTGTSSFAYLRDLPVDYLKIDGNFIRNLEHNAVDKAMTESINRIGHLMGKITVAEFAENDNTIELLREMGVDFAQGYGVCIPKPLLPEKDIEKAPLH
jgi:diguanylate cyclase (GGDEF)-like protein/PAS domain S-box-containing protein